MLRLQDRIRLTRPEIERFTKITGVSPAKVKTLDHLDEYVRKCKARFWGASKETRLVHYLLDTQYLRCLGRAA